MRSLKLAVVADDNRISRMILREILEQYGVQVMEASDGEQAFELIRAHRPELVISDILMPRCDGFQLATRLQNEVPELRPVLFMTTAVYKAQKWRHEVHTTYSAHEFLPKPVDSEILARALAKYFDLVAG